MKWLNKDTDDDLRDVSAIDIVPPKNASLMDIEVNSECEVLYEGRLYKIRVLGIGKLYIGCTQMLILISCLNLGKYHQCRCRRKRNASVQNMDTRPPSCYTTADH